MPLRRASVVWATGLRLLACLLLALAAYPGRGQAPASIPAAGKPAHAFGFGRAGQRRGSMRFFTQRNLIIVAAKLNGHGPYNFLLDTGVGSCLLTDPAVADSLRLRHGTAYRVLGAGGSATGISAYEADSVRLTLPGGVQAANLRMLVLSADALDLSGYVGLPIHGIIGAEFFRSFTVVIYPQQFDIRVYRPEAYQPPTGKRWERLPLQFAQDKPYVTASVRQMGGPAPDRADVADLPLRLLLDTGAGHALSLETTADPRLHLPPTSLRSDLGRGLTGVISGSLGRVAAVRLGRYQLGQVLTSFPDSSQVHQRLPPAERRIRHGNLGYEVLKRFVCVIDYPRQQLLLRPTAALREPFEHDMSGIDLLATGPHLRNYLVQRVLPGSPADDAGILPQEELVSINFMPVTGYSITEVNHLLHSEDGRILLLVLRRPDGKLHPTAVRLKRRI